MLTPNSFHRTEDDDPVIYQHVDGVIIIRYQHQIIRTTRCEPLIDGAEIPLQYYHEGFQLKAFIEVPGGRSVSPDVLKLLNAQPLARCMGAEYHPGGGGLCRLIVELAERIVEHRSNFATHPASQTRLMLGSS